MGHLGIRQRLSHDGLNRIVGLDGVSYTLSPECRSATTAPDSVLSSRHLRTIYWLTSVNIINDVSGNSGFLGSEYEDKYLVLRQQALLNRRYIHVFTRLHGAMFLKTAIFIVMLISF